MAASGQLYVQVAGLLEEEQRSLVAEELGYTPCEECLLPGEDAAEDGLLVEVVVGVARNAAVEALYGEGALPPVAPDTRDDGEQVPGLAEVVLEHPNWNHPEWEQLSGCCVSAWRCGRCPD